MSPSLLIIGPDIRKRGVGGVTIHVRRLRDYLDSIGFDHVFMDSRNTSLIDLVYAIVKHDIVHLHISNPVFLLALVMFSRTIGKKVVMTLHGDYGRFGRLKNHLVKMSISMSTVPIVLNSRSYEICKAFNENTRLIPAFIPPIKSEPLQEDVIALLDRLHSEGKKLISTNASNYALDKEGNDIYGIDFLIREVEGFHQMALVISDPSGSYNRIYEKKEGVCSKGSVFFINYPHPFFEVLKHVDYFVRNTSTDGDSLSVKEALYLGVPTICTSVVDRPEGVRLFGYCDKDSFKMCFDERPPVSKSVENGAERIVTVYSMLAAC